MEKCQVTCIWSPKISILILWWEKRRRSCLLPKIPTSTSNTESENMTLTSDPWPRPGLLTGLESVIILLCNKLWTFISAFHNYPNPHKWSVVEFQILESVTALSHIWCFPGLFPFPQCWGIQLTTARRCRKDKAEGSVCLCDVKQDVSSEALASPSLSDPGFVNSKFFSTLAPVRSLFTRPRIALVK